VWCTETVLYVPMQRWTSSGYRGPVNCNSLMLCGFPQISYVHCRLTTACCCCRTQATNVFCCHQTFQNRPTQRRVITRIQTTARVQQMGISGHGCHDSRRESRVWVGRRYIRSALRSPATAVSLHDATSRGCIVITIKLKLNLALFLYCLMHKMHFSVWLVGWLGFSGTFNTE